jgi:hypothetical protein
MSDGRTLRFSQAAQANIDETGAFPLDDLAQLRSGAQTAASLLEFCLDGADEDRAEGWREYVAALADYLSSEAVPGSAQIREWSREAGGAQVAWESGEGDGRLVGWRGANGTRAIETNGDPLWSESDEDFDSVWERRSLEAQP